MHRIRISRKSKRSKEVHKDKNKINAALLLLYDDERRFLLQHRTACAERFGGYWAFFGGGIKKGETPEDAVRREALEEINYRFKEMPTFVFERELKTADDSGRLYIFTQAFTGDKTALRLGEGQGWGWYHPSETQKLKMLEHDRKIMEEVNDFVDSNQDQPWKGIEG